MALQLRVSRIKSIPKLTGVIVAVFALMIQPFISLDIPAAFAVTPNDPIIGDITPVEDENIYKTSGAYTISADVTDPNGDLDTVRWTLSGAYDTNSDAESYQSVFTRNGNIWSGTYALNHPDFPNGTYSLKVIAKDLAGNEVVKTVNNFKVADQAPAAVATPVASPQATVGNYGGYSGINVDVNYTNIAQLTALKVAINRSNGGTVEKTAKQALIDYINTRNGTVTTLTTPIVVQATTYNEAGSQGWNVPVANWDVTTVPGSATVTMTFSDRDPIVVVVPVTEGNSTYATMAPSIKPITNTTTGVKFESLQAAIDDQGTLDGHVIAMNDDVSLSTSLNISKSITLNGNGHTIAAGFAKNGNNNNSAIHTDNKSNVKIYNVTVDGTGSTDLHGIKLFKGGDIILDGLTVKNFKYGVQVNGADVVVNNLTTSGNSWAAIEVDQASTTNPAKLTVTGTSSHAETQSFGNPGFVAHIWMPASNKPVSVVDSSSQYNINNAGNARAYVLKPANSPPVLTVVTPVENVHASTVKNGNALNVTGSFTDDDKANYATFQLVRNGSSVAIGTIYGYGSVYNRAATYADINGNYTYDLPVGANLSDGDYSIFYTGTDFSGNVTSRMERTFKIDNTAPKITVKSGYTGNGTDNIFSNVSFSFFDANKVDKYSINGQFTDFTNNNYSDANFQNIKNRLNNDVNTLVLYDVAGNTTTYTFTYDGISPVVGLTSPTGTTSANSVSVQGYTLDANMRYYACYITTNQTITAFGQTWTSGQEPKNAGQSLADQACVTSWTPEGKGSADNSVELGKFDISGLPDGSYTIYVHAHDQAGNATQRSIQFAIETPIVPSDTTAPVITMNPVQQRNSNGMYIFTGTTDDVDSPISISVDGVSVGEAIINQDTQSWSYTTDTLLSVGQHTVVAISTDAAGNVSNQGSRTFTVQSTTPTTPTTPVAPLLDTGVFSPLSTVSFVNASNSPSTVRTFGAANASGNTAAAADSATNDGEVLGTSATKKPVSTTAALSPSSEGWKVFGVAWYWWLAVLAAVVAAWLWLAAAVRRRREQEA